AAAQYEPAIADMQLAQQRADDEWSERVAQNVTRIPRADLIIRNTRVFDPRDLTVTGGVSVVVRGDRIIRVAADGAIKSNPDVELIDAHARFLMPGLWDNHQHFSDVSGALDL